MRKHKSILIVLAVAILVGAVGIFTAVRIAAANQSQFYSDGYVLQVDSSADGVEVSQVQFLSGTSMTVKYPATVEFRDVQGTKTSVSEENFIFYSDGSISALTDGSVMDLDEAVSGVVDFYYLKAKMVLTNSGTEYSIDNNNSTLDFQNLIWKISDDIWMVCAEEMELFLADESVQTLQNGYLQVTYLEDSIVRVTDGSNIWQVVTSGGRIVLGNGVIIDLEKKEIQDSDGDAIIGLGEIEIDAQTGIEVQSDTATAWEAPTFNFSVTDGQDGEAGESGGTGESGETGEAGKSGEEGEEGDAGETGESGSAGGTGGTAGSSGSSGSSGSTGSTLPRVYLTDLEYDCSTLSFSLQTSGDVDAFEPNTGVIQIVNTADGTVVWSSTDEGLTIDLSQYEDDPLEIDLEAYGVTLSADTEYQILVSSDYSLDDTSGTKVFLSRTIYTSSVGMTMDLDYATDSELDLTLDVKSYADVLGGKGLIAYSYMGSEGTTYVEVTGTLTEGEHDMTLSDLPSDTLVTVSYYATSGNSLTSSTQDLESYLIETEEYYTLKTTPTVTEVSVSKNSNYLALSIVTSNSGSSETVFADPDNAITGYRYEIYEESSDGSYTLVKTLTASDTTPVSLYLDGETIKTDSYYYVTAYAIYYDNYKTAEIAMEETYFNTYSVGTPIVYFDPETNETKISEWLEEEGNVSGTSTTDFNYMYGTLCIEFNSTDIDTSKDITIIMSTGSDWYEKTVWSSGGSSTQTVDGKYTYDSECIYIPVTEVGLKAGSSYRFEVWGYYNGSSTLTYLGNCAVSTSSADSLSATLTAISAENLTDGSSFAVTISLEDCLTDAGTDEVSVEMASLSAVCVGIYSTGTESLIATCVYPTSATSSDDGATYSSTLSQMYLNEESLTVTSNDFDVTSISGTIDVKVICGYDYTCGTSDFDGKKTGDYVNEIPISSNTVTVTLATSAPSFPEGDGVEVTTITNGNVATYTGDSSDKDSKLQNSDTTMGFELQAKYDNSDRLAQYVIYYGFKATDYEDFQDSELKSDYKDILDYIATCAEEGTECEYEAICVEIPAGNANALSSLSVVFSDDADKIAECEEKGYVEENGRYIYYTDKLERGYHYYFAYTALLTITTDQATGKATYEYPYDVTGSYTYGQTIFISSLVKAPKEEPTIEVWLEHTTPYTASWSYEIIDPDGTVLEYQDQSTYTGYTLTQDNAGDLIENGNVGYLPLILTGTSSQLSSLPSVPYASDGSTGSSAVDTAGTAAENLAWTTFSGTERTTSTNGVVTYTGTVIAGDDDTTNSRQMYLYNQRSELNGTSPYYFAVRRDLYVDGYVDEELSTSEQWDEMYQTFGGHQFDYYDMETAMNENTPALVLDKTLSGITKGTQNLELVYNVTSAAASHIMAFRVELVNKDDESLGVRTLSYTYNSSEGTITVSVDVGLYGVEVGEDEYNVNVYAIYDTGISGLDSTITGGSASDETNFNNAYRNTAIDKLPEGGFAIQTLTGSLYAYTEDTETNGGRSLVFRAATNSGKGYYVITAMEGAGTRTINSALGDYDVDGYFEVSRYSMVSMGRYFPEGCVADMNLLYTDSGAQLYGNAGVTRYAVFKQLAVGDTETDFSFKVDALYPSITQVYDSDPDYPSFGNEVIYFSTSSSELIVGTDDAKNYSSYMYMELYIWVEDSSYESGGYYERVENQTDYFTEEQITTVTLSDKTYYVPAIEMEAGTSSYVVNLQNLEYGAEYLLRWYVLPTADVLATISSTNLLDENGDLYLKKFLAQNIDNAQLVANGISGQPTAYTTTSDNDKDSSSILGSISDLDKTGVCFTFEMPESLTIGNLSAEYVVDGYESRYLEVTLQPSHKYDYWLQFVLYENYGTAEQHQVLSHNEFMLALGYTAYDDSGNAVAEMDLKDNVLYTWMKNGTKFSYTSTSEMKLQLEGLDAVLEEGVTYTLEITTYYEPDDSMGKILSTESYTNAETGNGYDVTTVEFERTDTDTDPIYTLSTTSSVTDGSVTTLTIKYQVWDTTYRIWTDTTSGSYTVKIYEKGTDETAATTIAGGTTNTALDSVMLYSSGNGAYLIGPSTTYVIEIWGSLDGGTAKCLYSTEKTTVGASGVDIDTSSISVVNTSSGILRLTMNNSSGLDQITSISYTVYPVSVANDTDGTLSSKSYSYTITSSSSDSLFSALTSGGEANTRDFALSSYLSQYSLGDTFVIQLKFMKGSTTLETASVTFSKLHE
ncbi:MAG: hypothetical protein LUE31_12800 [Lachnospiraceae bacterium]|nr:hypothetical protein [Lachnospiraceae bacterium]